MQYRITVFLLVLIAFVINTKPVYDLGAVQSARSITSSAFFPMQYAINASNNAAAKVGDFIVKSYFYKNEIDKLKLENSRLSAEAKIYSGLAEENSRLRSELGFAKNGAYNVKLVPANIIDRAYEAWGQYIIIDAGLENGAKAGDAVISTGGLVGKIVEASTYTSKVLLITSRQSAVSVVLPKSQTYGVLKGNDNGTLMLEFVPEHVSIEIYEKIVVSAASSAYLSGVLAANITKVEKSGDNLFLKVEANPSADLAHLGTVFICKK